MTHEFKTGDRVYHIPQRTHGIFEKVDPSNPRRAMVDFGTPGLGVRSIAMSQLEPLVVDR